MTGYKHLFSRSFAAAPARLHFAAHSHHLWPDASYDGHLEAWHDAAHLADRKWDKVFDTVLPRAAGEIAAELNLPDASSLAFAPNTHDLLARVFSARAERPIRVLTSDGEFHSFRRQAARWAEAGLVRLHVVPCAPFESFGARVCETFKVEQPDVAFFSHIMFKSGLRFDDVATLAEHARPDGPWIVLDLYHSFMALPCDFSALADRVFLLGGAYKYAMSGEGACFLHAPPGFAARPVLTGWMADFGAIEAKQGEIGYACDGRRFLGATFDPSALYRFNAVRAMLAREGLDTNKIAHHVAPLRAALENAIASGDAGDLREAEMLRPNKSGPQPRFLALRHPHATAWKAKLIQADVITDARDDVLRIGLGLYHDLDDVSRFCTLTRRALD